MVAINNYPTPSSISLSIGKKSFMVPEYTTVPVKEESKLSNESRQLLIMAMGAIFAVGVCYVLSKQMQKESKKKKRSKSPKTK